MCAESEMPYGMRAVNVYSNCGFYQQIKIIISLVGSLDLVINSKAILTSL